MNGPDPGKGAESGAGAPEGDKRMPERGKLPLIAQWPVYRQLTGADRRGLGAAASSRRTRELTPRTATADRVVKSVCPYCAVGCAQNVYVQDGRVTQIEGDPDSPVSRAGSAPKAQPACSSPPGEPASTRCCTGGRAAPSGSTSAWIQPWT